MMNQFKDLAKPFSEIAESTKAVTSIAQAAQGLVGTKDLFGGAAPIGMQAFNEGFDMGEPN